MTGTVLATPIRRSDRRLQTRAAIVSAAARLFAAGQHDCTVEHIAREAGCSRTLVYKHFADREAVRAAVVTRQYDWWGGHLLLLGSEAVRSLDGVRGWLTEFSAGFAGAGEITFLLMSTASLSERGPVNYQTRRAAAIAIGDRLGLVGPPGDRARPFRCLTEFLMRAEWLCLNLAWARAGAEGTAMLDDLAADFIRIVDESHAISSRTSVVRSA